MSKFETSVSDLITGIKGGLYYFFNKNKQTNRNVKVKLKTFRIVSNEKIIYNFFQTTISNNEENIKKDSNENQPPTTNEKTTEKSTDQNDDHSKSEASTSRNNTLNKRIKKKNKKNKCLAMKSNVNFLNRKPTLLQQVILI